MCEKKPGANLPGVVHHKLWHGQLREPVPNTPVHSGRSSRVVVVAQEVDGLAVLPGDGTQSSPAPEFVPATLGQLPAEFLGVVLAAVLLDGEAVVGGNHALVEAELLAGAVVAAKEREHSVEHGPDFVYLVGLVHGLVRLID